MTAHRAAMKISKLTFHPISVYKSGSSMRRLRQSHWARVTVCASDDNAMS
jgi:hypothetical protein